MCRATPPDRNVSCLLKDPLQEPYNARIGLLRSIVVVSGCCTLYFIRCHLRCLSASGGTVNSSVSGSTLISSNFISGRVDVSVLAGGSLLSNYQPYLALSYCTPVGGIYYSGGCGFREGRAHCKCIKHFVTTTLSSTRAPVKRTVSIWIPGIGRFSPKPGAQFMFAK